jgi:hypothetical protein
MSAESRKLVALTHKIANDLGVKFCTSCSLTRPASGGKTVLVANGRTRWKCASCTAHMRPSGFKTKRRDDAVPPVRQQDGLQPDEKLYRS